MTDNSSAQHAREILFDFSEYTPPKKAQEVLYRGRIIAASETPQKLLERVVSTLFSVERVWSTNSADIKKTGEEFAEYMTQGYVMPGTPMLTNAGRYNAALSSCALIPVDLQEENSKTEQLIRSYYRQNMGAGFDFTASADPVTLLSQLNTFCAEEAATGRYNRYIGNMGMLHIAHPSTKNFMEVKRYEDMPHFNISIDVTEDFMRRAEEEDTFALSDGTEINAAELLEGIAENAWFNGDPGLIFMERMNRDNAIAEITPYISTPSCAEMGLAKGEACHFGYINLHRFVCNEGDTVRIDYSKLERATYLLTRALDNAVEYSLPRYPHSLNAKVSLLGRKIAIGVCGLADTFIAYRLPYDSQEARNLARDMLSFINYVSKCTSVALAEQRGSCLAMDFPAHMNKYLSTHFLEDKYASRHTCTVSARDWEQLANTIRTTRKLRNVATTALSPTGRSSILLDATASIEPLFSIFAHNGELHPRLINFLDRELKGNEPVLKQIYNEAIRSGSFQDIETLSVSVRSCLKTAKEIAPIDHLLMVAELAGMQGVIDESASKTVNLPHQTAVNDVKDVFLASYRHGLKNISVYRDQTKNGQPEML